MSNVMTKEEMENEFILASAVIGSMFEGIYKENIDIAVTELVSVDFRGNDALDTEGMMTVLLRHSLNRMFNRATKFALVFLENAANYCLNRNPKEKFEEIQELYNKYFELSTEAALEIYNRTWTTLLENTKYNDIEMDIYNMIGVEEAYSNREELNELLRGMPRVSEEKYRDFLYGKADKSNEIYVYLTKTSLN